MSAVSSITRRPLVAEHIARIRPFVPGRPISAVQRELGLTRVVKLASNESPLGPSPLARGALSAAMQDLSRYPDAGHFDLRAALAAHTGVDAPCFHFQHLRSQVDLGFSVDTLGL